MFCKKNQTLRTIIKAIFTEQKGFYTSKAAEPIKYPKKNWTAEESKKLLELVEIHGTNWQIIQKHFPDRGRKSVGGRYHFLKQKASGDIKSLLLKNVELPRSGRWTVKEDEKLMRLTDEYGLLWTKICQHFENRAASDLLQRYSKLKQANKNQTGTWSEFEKQKFDSLVSIHGKDFNTIASLMKTRTIDQCKARYSYISGKTTILSHLKEEQLERLKESIEKYGLDDFEQLVEDAVLPLNVSELDVRKYYRQELDPNIVRSSWTPEEMNTMVQLLQELEGRMDLVQSRLPRKRSLKDMWVQYEKYCNSRQTEMS